MTEITEHLAEIRERIERAARAANRDAASVTLVAVSKQQPSAALEEAYRAGQRHFGESYVQEALPKMDALAALAIEWHFIGTLQANKTRAVAERFHWVHTLDREKIAARLDRQRPPLAPPLNVLIQVNVAGEPQKGGAALDEVEALAGAVARMPRLALRGLMCIPPAGEPPLRWFTLLAATAARLRRAGIALDSLSMGMSADFEAAIAAGSTLVRIGTAVFGARR